MVTEGPGQRGRNMMEREKTMSGNMTDGIAVPEKIIRTWRWELPEEEHPVPETAGRYFYRCRRCSRNGLVPYQYEGETYYVCRSCGSVYEVIPEAGKNRDPIRLWRVLTRQQYEWEYIRHPSLLNYHFIHGCGDITEHPLIDAHCRGDRADSLELIARYFSRRLDENSTEGVRFFHEDISRIRITRDDGALVLAAGGEQGRFPEDEFCVYREERDSLSLEVSHFWHENSFGFTADVNLDDYECYAGYHLWRLMFLGCEDSCLSDRIREAEERPGTALRVSGDDSGFDSSRQIVREPFGLAGYYLFEQQEKTIFRGTMAEL